MEKQTEYFPVIRISRDDLINIVLRTDKKLIKKIRNLSDSEMKHVAERMCDYIYNGDDWDDGCRFIVDKVI